MNSHNFVHLRVHTAYSLAEGAIKIPDLIKACQEQCMPAIGITDTGNLFGALEFALAAKNAGVQPIIGCQIKVDRSTSKTFTPGFHSNEHGLDLDTLVLIVQDEKGYKNLLKLVSSSFLTSSSFQKPHITFEDLIGKTEGLIALTGGPDGALIKLLSEKKKEEAKGMLDCLSELFAGRLYIELTRHGMQIEKETEGDLIRLAYETDIPLVATNDCYFLNPEMYEAHDALLCIAEGKKIEERDRRVVTPLHAFRTSVEMNETFADVPEAIQNTVVIAQRCSFMPEEQDPILPTFPTVSTRTEEEQLKIEAKNGLTKRFKNFQSKEIETKPYWERLDFELKIIIEMGFSGYFLIVADFIQWAKKKGIPVGPGRGSGAGSVVAWALEITNLDPLKFGLIFERFLNPERVSMPDFDIDFCQDRRDEVIRYVQGKFGEDRVAQIITFGKLQARAVLRDVGRVLSMPYGYVDKICKLIPFNPAHPPSLQEAIDSEIELRRLRNEDPQVKKLLDIGLRLEGLYRHASTHAAGLVIGDRSLVEIVPLYRDMRSNMTAVQFSMKYAEASGLVKFDFLGLKTLTVISRAVELLSERGVNIDIDSLPLDDKSTYEMLAKGQSIGVFQLESSGMRDVLFQLRPDCFEDIIALVALYRPGPMDNIPRYIACKHGREKPDYLHPKLEGILTETFGVIIYQEQVMEIAKLLSGFSLGKADLLRRAMGKKIKSEMTAQRESFIEGAKIRNVEANKAAQIFDQVDKFAGYGFNKSHAAAYALIAYQTAWLKANYPVEFFAASMTLDMGNTDKINVFKQELANLSIELLPPNINESNSIFSTKASVSKKEKGVIRYALGGIKNVGLQSMERVVKERSENGPFIDIFDLAERLCAKGINRRQMENLIRSGALDCLDSNRKKLFEGIEKILTISNFAEREREDKQENLFSTASIFSSQPNRSLLEVEDWPIAERLNQEFDAVGFYLSAHPLDVYGSALKDLGITSQDQLTQAAVGSLAKLAGIFISMRERTSEKGNRYAFVEFSNASGVFEVVVFSEILSKARDLLKTGIPLIVTCEVRVDGQDFRLNAVSIEDLETVTRLSKKGLKIYIDQENSLHALKDAFALEKNGNEKIRLILGINEERSVELVLPGTYLISSEMRKNIQNLPGIIELYDG